MTKAMMAPFSAARVWAFLSLLAAQVLACGEVSTNPPVCNGTSCVCEAGGSCDVSTQSCGASCTLACDARSSCGGACGDSCSIDCSVEATCTITLGASGSISCKPGSICRVSCVAGCSMSCADGATCQLKCADDDTFHSVNGGASC